MLHITNGDSVGNALILGPLHGDVIAWRDVLHEGPVPAELSLAELSRVRAKFIFDWGMTESLEATLEGFAARDAALAESTAEDEVVLWFEHDLYDQLQLIQLLDWFATRPRERTRLSLISEAEYLGPLKPSELTERFSGRHPVTPDQLTIAQAAWSAFRSPDPRMLVSLLDSDLTPLPFLAAALHRHLQQFPWETDGLSRSERQALHAFRDGPTTVTAAFLISQEHDEPAVFLGDSTFACYLVDLGAGCHPLVQFTSGERLSLPQSSSDYPTFWQQEVMLTDTGRAVLQGELDRVALLGLDRWLGGVHVHSPDSVWRWNEREQRILPPGK